MYSLDEFGEMVADELRFPTYSERFAQAVRPGDCVLDIGSGPGVFALTCVQGGSAKGLRD